MDKIGEQPLELVVEQGEATPLLNKYDDIALQKTSDWRAPAIILGFECLESLGFYGIATNLVIYLGSILHESNADIAIGITTWSGTSYFAPFIGALIADSCCGSYWMILSSSFLDLTGMTLLTLSASFPSIKPQKFIFFSGLYFIAFGSGCMRASLLPLGADQFNDDNPEDRQKKASFFNWFYFCINVGALTSSTLIVWIQENIDWGLGYGIATACMVMAIGAFVCGSSTFRLRKPRGSPITRIFQVVIVSLRKMKCKSPEGEGLLYDPSFQGIQKLQHTDEFRFLDKAAIITDADAKDNTSFSSWRLCSVSQIEELKILLRLLPIWFTSILYSVAYAQLFTTFIEQGKAMDTSFGSFSVPPASVYAFEVVSVMIWVLIFDTVIVPTARGCSGNPRGLTQLQRMGIGHVLMIVTMVVSAILESNRLRDTEINMSVGIAWQLPQYFLMAGSEVFNYIGQLEFFYDQGPRDMRSMCTAFSLMTIALGNYLNSLIVSVLMTITTSGGMPGWIPDDLNVGHLDYFFWSLAGLCGFNFFGFVWCAKRYRVKEFVSEG